MQSKTFDAHDIEGLGNIQLSVDLYKIPVPSDGVDTPPIDNSHQQLKGKVLELSGKCLLKDLTVIIQAKEKLEDTIYKVVGAATTGNAGNFMMKYPFGVFVAAQAIVSLTPDNPFDIPIFSDQIHIDSKQTISNDFLFLLLKDVICMPADNTNKDDCGCHDIRKTSRLPNQEDLINSDEFSQDLGGGTCVNLTTPNRTLSETVHYAIVRTSEPDVANYRLEKETVFDSTDPTNFDKNKTTFRLSDGQLVVRKPVSLGNPIHWHDTDNGNSPENLTIYQAVQVAHGHLLTYKTVWKADGYSLGELLYSLPLAPGQKKQIVVYDLKHSLQASEQQQISQRESLNASITNDRTILDNLSGSINESIRGRSSASTGGVSGGLGIAGMFSGVAGVLGISGGYSNSNSNAGQDSSRATSQSFNESLRTTISQTASAYRKQNATVIDTVSEDQQFSTTSEVVANHNHCHALTMLYFEVLRHYGVYQELAQVEECIFVPLLMTNFTTENIYKWRDVLAANLLDRPSSTYLTKLLGQHPLLKAFDANERIKTNYVTVDFPVGAYDEERIREVIGELYVRVNFERPKTRYDRIKSWPLVKEEDTHSFWAAVGGLLAGPIGVVVGGMFDSDGNIKIEVQNVIDQYVEINANYVNVPPAQSIRVINIDEFFFNNDSTSFNAWNSYANLLGNPSAIAMLKEFFENHLISEWDSIFYDNIAPALIKKLADNLTLDPFNADFTVLGKYNGGEKIIRFNFRGTTSLTRKLVTDITLKMSNSQTIASELTTIIAENISIRYITNHYNGTIFSSYLGDDLSSTDTVVRTTPESSDEKRNPRLEDIFIVNELISHLNGNLEYYNKVLWYMLDTDRRYLLLDGFNIEVFNDILGGIVNKSLASVVKNELIGVAGNSLIFPVAQGVNLDRRNIIIQSPSTDGENTTSSLETLKLFDHYKPLTPIPPYRISVPTRGVFAEAVQGSCDACEKVKDNTSQDWDKFKTDEPTAINPITVPTPSITDFKPTIKDFATPIVNIQNAPAAPAPGAGLAELATLLGKPDIFKDITGLDGNQKNVLATYLSNQENAKAFGNMAKEIFTQSHNSQNADKIQDGINNSNLSQEEKDKLTKAHLQQMIDGGESKKAEAQSTKPTLTDAAVKAADQGKPVKATTADGTGKTESVDIGASKETEKVLAEIIGAIPNLKQDNDNACWAFAATIMMSWKKQNTLSVEDVLKQADNGTNKYLDLYTAKQTLPSSFKGEFMSNLTMIGEKPDADPTIQQFIDWVRTYGPLWLTTDSDADEGVFSPHARVLIKITGPGTPNGIGTNFVLIDPTTGEQVTQSFNDFMKEFKQMISDNPSPEPFIQIVHFEDTVTGEGKGKKAMQLFEHANLSAKFHKDTDIFDDAPSFLDQATGTSKKDTILQTALDNLINSNPIFTDNKNHIQLAVVDLSDIINPKFAGWQETTPVYGASATKVGAFYAAFQLLFDIKELFKSDSTLNSKIKLKKALNAKWGKNSKPNISRLFSIPINISSENDVNFSPYFHKAFFPVTSQDIDIINHNNFNFELITALSFEYIGSVIFQTGLFNKQTKGIWVNWRYGHKIKNSEGEDVEVSPRWNNSPYSVPTACINGLSMATYYTLIAQKKMAFSEELANTLSGGCITQASINVFGQMPPSWESATTTKIIKKCGLDSGSVHDTISFEDDKKRGVIIILTKSTNYINPDLFKALYNILPNKP